MAVTLTKEDGTQVTGANTYLTLAEAETFFESYFFKTVWDDASDSDKNIALVNAARILDDQFTWNGQRSNPDTQAMQWPRAKVTEGDRNVATNEIPEEIQRAQAILAQEILWATAFTTRDPGADGADQLAGINLGKGALQIDYQSQTTAGANSLKYKTVVTAEIMQMISRFGRFKHGSSMVKVHRG